MLNTIDRLRQRRDDELEGQGGFTLIEILIVIVILGILAGIVVFAFQDVVGSSAQAACKSDYKTVETTVEAFKARMGHYPIDQTDAGTPGVVNNTPPGTPYALPTGFTLPSGTTDLVGALMTQPGANGSGPWLRDFPGNGSHYQIVVTANATSGQASVIDVYKVNGSGSVAGAGATHTVADCGNVS